MRHIEITDLPTDRYGKLRHLRSHLRDAYNRNREDKETLELVRANLKYVLNHTERALKRLEEVVKEPVVEEPVVEEEAVEKAPKKKVKGGES